MFANDPTALTRSGTVLGTPAYMAPEQLQGRPCDSLSDQFSFCVSAYEALFGRRPFPGEDVAELAKHVLSGAIRPIPSDSPVPLRLQQAVLRGLASEPQRRWPSMGALLDELDSVVTMAELHAYLEQMREAGAGELVERELPRADRLRVPERLYGREAQLELLVEAFERTRKHPPRAQLVLVSGPAGIGKSSLVERLRPRVEAKGGLMCAGNFDAQRSTPLAGIVEALDDLITQIERLDFTSQLRLRRELSDALGRNARLLTELVPAAARLLDDPELVGESSGEWHDRDALVGRFATIYTPEQLNQLRLAIGRFLLAVASSKHPLVLVVDDLQWIDEPSLSLLQYLLSNAAQRALLIVGAFRSDEISAEHPLPLACEQLESIGVSTVDVELQPLSLADTEALLIDTLGADRKAVREFAALALGKTDGNPFYLRQLLRTIYDEGLFEFDAATDAWRWNLDRIAECSAFDDIHEVLLRNLEGLPAASQQLVRIAACAGHRVELRTLAAAVERPPLEVFSELWPTLERGLLIVESGLFEQVDELESAALASSVGAVVLRFGHERIRQAALASLGEQERARTHLTIGRILRRRLAEDEQAVRVFEVADQLDAGRSLIEPSERVGLLELNLRCGRRAIESGAFASAIEYLEIAAELLLPNAATVEHALWFAVELERARALTLDGRYAEAVPCYRALLEQAKDDHQRLRVHVAEVEHAHLVADYESGYAACQRGFALLGIELPELDQDAHAMFVAELEQLERNLAGRSPISLAELPDFEDHELFPVPELLHALGSLSFVSGRRNVNGWIIARTANLAMRSGNSKVSTVAYGRIAMHLAERGDYELAKQFGELVFLLCRRFDDPATTGRAMLAYLGHAAHYERPVLELLPDFEDAFEKCLEGGEFLFAGHHLWYPQYCRLVGGAPLSEVMVGIHQHVPFLRRSVPSTLAGFYVPHVVLTTCTLMDVPLAELGLSFDHRSFIEGFGRLSLAMAWYYSALTKLDYLLGRPVPFDELERRIATVELGTTGHLTVREVRYYAILILLAGDVQASLSDEQRARAHTLIESWRADLARCAARCPSNFRHKHLLVEAELAHVRGGSLDQAIVLYEQAIDDAREHGVIDQEALACWRFAEFWRTHGSTRTAYIYLETARDLYESWGAKRMVREIDERYGQLRPSARRSPRAPVET
ncbi:MAG TPA: AAA family ATPase [Enhygromyxa sp.]|nr:AAA family ATPase [Enhygromyxa sp.]